MFDTASDLSFSDVWMRIKKSSQVKSSQFKTHDQKISCNISVFQQTFYVNYPLKNKTIFRKIIEFFLSHATFEHFFTRQKMCDKSATLFVINFQLCFAGQYLLMELQTPYQYNPFLLQNTIKCFYFWIIVQLRQFYNFSDPFPIL